MTHNRFIGKKADRICTGRKDKKINLIDRSITPNNFSFTKVCKSLGMIFLTSECEL